MFSKFLVPVFNHISRFPIKSLRYGSILKDVHKTPNGIEKIKESLVKPPEIKISHLSVPEEINQRKLSAIIRRPDMLEEENLKDKTELPQFNPPDDNNSKMEALVLSRDNRDVFLCNVTVPTTIRRDEVCIMVKYAAATITDLRIIDGKVGKNADGVIMGRELSGVVCGAGDAIHHVKAGDQVVVSPCQPLSICRYCHEKNKDTCIKENCDRFYGIDRNGGWTNFTIVPGNMVYRVEGIGFEKAALLPQLAQVMCAATRLDIQTKWHVLIQGSGLAGILLALLLHRNGHERVTMLEDHPLRMKILSSMGIQYPIVKTWEAKNVDVVLTSGGGAEVMQEAYTCLSPNGQIIVYSQAGKNGDNPKLRLTTSDLSRRGVTIKGLSGTPANPSNVPQELANEIIDFKRLGVQVHPLKDHATALTNLATGDASSVVFSTTK